MPGYKGHIFGAAVCTAGYVAAIEAAPAHVFPQHGQIITNVELTAGLFVVAVLFGLFPDIDTNSKGQNIFFGMAFVLDIILIYNGYYVAAALLGLLAMTPILGHHRGWTHSKPAMLLVPSPILVIPYLYQSAIIETFLLFYGAAVVGYFSHLLFDGCITRYVHFKGGR